MVHSRRTGDVELYERLRFRPATVVAAAAVVTLAVAVALDARYLPVAAFLSLVLWLAWAIVIWPRLVIDLDGVWVRNTFTTARIPYADLAGVRSGLALDLELRGGRRMRAWAVPGNENLGMEAMRTSQAYEGGFQPVRRVDDLSVGRETTAAGQVAASISRRAAVAEEERAAAGRAVTQDAGGVDRRINVWIVIGTFLFIAPVAAVALGML
jgi:hypothetical protein